MTDQPTSPTPAQPDLSTPERGNWWRRNRLALLLLLPLATLAVLASSYNFFTLYRPNHFTRAHQASSNTLAYHETFSNTGFGDKTEKKWYTRDVTLTLKSVQASPGFQGQQAAKGATLWVVSVEFRAPPEVILNMCQFAIEDTAGALYNDTAGKIGLAQRDTNCVPKDAPGATFDFDGSIVTQGNPRPAAWTVQRSITMPEGRQPKFVRVAWQPPDYAQFKVP